MILIKSESRFPIRRKRIKQRIKEVLKKQGLTSSIEVSLAFVGPRKIRQLNRDFRGIDRSTSVLSFSQMEKRADEPFRLPPSDVMRLGDVVICYQEAQRLASQEGIMVEEEIDRLVEHGLLHLLGIHH